MILKKTFSKNYLYFFQKKLFRFCNLWLQIYKLLELLQNSQLFFCIDSGLGRSKRVKSNPVNHKTVLYH